MLRASRGEIPIPFFKSNYGRICIEKTQYRVFIDWRIAAEGRLNTRGY